MNSMFTSLTMMGNFILGWGSRGSGPGQFYHFGRLIMMVAEN